MGSRYFFIVAYIWLEKYFSRGDYRRDTALPTSSATDESSMGVSPMVRVPTHGDGTPSA
jgi:hypothetical protein